ncbi:hypothetical protein SCG7086_BW_00080 [Chlamydiales bacterium SCGC AG-110-P3]|nr:hypothetical protein SCG7086_BW_00080 [Chlamydiales bacterium SCGC AG-110-P3]
MNILVYVLVLTLAMAIGITARMPSTLLGVQVRRVYSEQMAERESHALRIAAIKQYDNHQVTQATAPSRRPSRRSEKKVTGPRLRRVASLHVAIYEPEDPRRQLFRDLLEVLFQNERWYIDRMESNSVSIDQLLDALVEHWPERPVEGVRDLATIELENGHLQGFLKNILEGGFLSPNEKDLYFDLQKKKGKVSIYLAREALLLAIYKDPDLVAEIMTERVRIFKQYKSELKNDLSAKFERLFARSAPHEYDFLDFRVSGTDPRKGD